MLDFKCIKKGNDIYIETSITGKLLLNTPQLNKGTAFTEEERTVFNLKGKLPNHIESMDAQLKRAYMQYQAQRTPLKKSIYLNGLHDSNQVLFYNLLSTHLKEMLPIVYTPTVGLAVEKFSRSFVHARGIYIAFEDQDRIEEILDNRSNPEIELIVVTDGGGVLGIGDQGVGAMMIPVAKLMVYTLAAKINPTNTLPILLDAGTDNEKLRDDPYYLGWRHARVTGKAYDVFIEKFVTAIKTKFPNVFLHWEDFGRANAQKILSTYQNDLCTFNDDIQGTGVVTLAALLSGAKVNNSTLKNQRFVVFGAGTAGVGISEQIVSAMVHKGMTEDEARKHFWLIDRQGLLLDNMDNLTPAQKPFARPANEVSDWVLDDPNNIMLADVIKNIKPTVLLGCSGVSGAFTKDIISEMYHHCKHPMIFPLSNPTDLAEATPQQIMDWTQGNALVATGSPFAPVNINDETVEIAQCNNALAFPGIGLALLALKSTCVNIEMLYVAAEALAQCAPAIHNHKAPLLPNVENAQDAALAVATAVAEKIRELDCEQADKAIPIDTLIKEKQWQATYLPYKLK